MNIASRWMVTLGLAAALAAVTPPGYAAAQEVQVTGPLAGAPAVKKMRIYRDDRFQLKVGFGVSMQDEFIRHLMITAQAQYHFVDWLGIGLFGGYSAAHLSTSLTDQIEQNGITTDNNILSLPSNQGFDDQVGTINGMVGLQATFIPLRGKLALFQAAFVDTDFYIFAGALMAAITERANAELGTGDAGGQCATSFAMGAPNVQACLANQGADSNRFAIAPTFGAGLSLYFTDYVSMTLEWRALPFKWNNSGTDQAGQNSSREPDPNGAFPDGQIDDADQLFEFNQMLNISAAFYFPVKAKLSD